MTVRERILQIIDIKTNGSVREFERIVGLGNNYVGKLDDNITSKKVKQITDVFPELNPSWIQFGTGEMYCNCVENNLHGIEKEIEDLKDKFRLQSITIEQLEARIKEKDDLIREKEKRLEEKERTIQILLKQTNLVELQKTTVG